MRKVWLFAGALVAGLLVLTLDVRHGDFRGVLMGKTLRHWAVVDFAARACAFDDSGGFPCGSSFTTGGGGATGGNTPTFVQGVIGTGVAGPVTTVSATGSAVGTGNAVIGAAMFTGNQFSLNTITDDKGNNYSVAQTQIDVGSSEVLVCFYQTGIMNAPSTITVTTNGLQVFLRVTWDEYRNVAALDTSSSNLQSAPGTGANAITSTSLTPTVSGDLLWSAGNLQQGNGSSLGAGELLAAGTGKTLRTQSTVGNDEVMSTADAILASTAAAAGTFTASVGTGDYSACALAMKHS